MFSKTLRATRNFRQPLKAGWWVSLWTRLAVPVMSCLPTRKNSSTMSGVNIARVYGSSSFSCGPNIERAGGEFSLFFDTERAMEEGRGRGDVGETVDEFPQRVSENPNNEVVACGGEDGEIRKAARPACK